MNNKSLKGLINLVPFWLRKRIRHIPILKQIQGKLVEQLNNEEFEARISAGPAKGLVFPVKMPDDKLMWIGTWESAFSGALSYAIQPGWVCYDIGGYKGYYSGIMALRGASQVFVFEPMPANIARIESLISLNPSLPITLVKAAISDSNEPAVFKIMSEATMGKLTKSSFQDEDKAMKEIEVDTISLDTILLDKKFPLPDFIKIDVEGAEEFVIMGGMNMLGKKRPMLMIEIHSPEIGKRVVKLLRPLYPKIYVFEDGKDPEQSNLPICHFIAQSN